MNNYNLNIDNLLNKYMHIYSICEKGFMDDKSENDFVLIGMEKVLTLVMQDLAQLTTQLKQNKH